MPVDPNPRRPSFPWRDFIHPRYWSTWLGLSVLRTLQFLPIGTQHAIGRGLGKVAFKLLKRKVHVARTNINLCFPNLDEDEKETLLHDHFQAYGMGIFETCLSWWGNRKQLAKISQVIGLEHLSKAQDQGKGVVIVTGHFTMMELGGEILSLHHPIGAMYRPLKNKLIDEVVKRARSRRVGPVFTQNDIRSMAKSLRTGHSIVYAYDQNYATDHSIFIPFFGIPAATITTTSRFATMGKALVMPCFSKRLKDGSYSVTIHPPLENFPSGDEEADTLLLNSYLEAAIKGAPEQYFWFYKRFKARPPGSVPIY